MKADIPVDERREIRVNRPNDAPDPHRVPVREGLLRDVRKDDARHLMCELKSPRAEER